MLRAFLSALLGAAVVAAAVGTVPAQQPKGKGKEKGPPRIAIDDPAKLKDDADFATQGEYVGTVAGMKFGAQVIALDEGKFDVIAYEGGLPGDGWDGKTKLKMTGARDGANVALMADNKKPAGVIDGGAVKVTGPDATGELKKVERKSPTLGAKPPEGAVVLFGGPGDEAKWTNGKLIELSDGKFLNYGIKSKQAFGSFKAHVEFRLPWMPNSRGQGRANSGVYLQDRYEVQVLDSFGLKGENNECGGVYTQHKPSVNMCLPPMAWQTYDIEFTAAKFDGDKKVANARLTLLHNGVKVHDNVELPKECPGGQKESAAPGPFQFQNHGDPLAYRNVWVVEIK